MRECATLLLLVLFACALVLVPSGTAKPRDGIPAWVGASATQTLTHVFGNPTMVANWNIPYPRTVRRGVGVPVDHGLPDVLGTL